MQVWIEGVALIGPGLSDWNHARGILRGEAEYREASVPALKPQLLPANERRRATPLIRLAVSLAEQAVAGSEHSPGAIATVFSSLEGDRDMADRICHALSLPEKPVSPTHFHNSVHNAPAGYWAIASGSRQCSVSIAAGEESFAVGLVEAATLARSQHVPVLLVACDVEPPAALAHLGHVTTTFGCALLLTAQPGPNAVGVVSLETRAGAVGGRPLPAWATPLARDNPHARSLSLFQALAQAAPAELELAVGEALSLRIEVAPC